MANKNHEPQENNSTVLETAWQHYAEYDLNSYSASRQNWQLRSWVIILGVIATALAILTDSYIVGDGIVDQTMRIALIIVPILGSVILALANKFQEGLRWLALKNGAEEIRRDIYLYRTILKNEFGREEWLDSQIASVQQRTLESLSGNLVLNPYKGNLPPPNGYAADEQDEGFKDLTPEEYIKFRLNRELTIHSEKIVKLQSSRKQALVWIFALGGLGTLIAALSNIEGLGRLSVWVAFTTAISAALASWLELRKLDWRVTRGSSFNVKTVQGNKPSSSDSSMSVSSDPLDTTIETYSQLIVELKIIRDHWYSLKPEERKTDEFFDLVLQTEKVLWGQDFLQSKSSQDLLYIVATQMKDSSAIDGSFEDAFLSSQKTRPTTNLQSSAVEDGEIEAQFEGVEFSGYRYSETRPHALVLMPTGRKEILDNIKIDFGNIYEKLVYPALFEAGFDVFFYASDQLPGDMVVDFIQELLMADIVLADLTTSDANIFYLLGIRHSLRKRGIIHILADQVTTPYDIFSVRQVQYRVGRNGRVDQRSAGKNKNQIGRVARDTWISGADTIHSPIFNLLMGLEEPDRKTLRTPLATGYWREYNEWKERVTIAQRQKRIGDILLLTEEISNPLIKEEGVGQAGRALQNMRRYELALMLYRQGLEINPNNVEFRREEAYHLNRLGRVDEAIVKLEYLLDEYPGDIEAIAYLGRIYRDMWRDSWEGLEDDEKRIQEAFVSRSWLIKSIQTYQKGYSTDLNDYYHGINAFIQASILVYLAEKYDSADEPDPEVIRIQQMLPKLKGALLYALEAMAQEENSDFWTLVTLAELKVMTATKPIEVEWAYQATFTKARRNVFYLESSLHQLEFFRSLNIRPEFVAAGVNAIDSEIQRIQKDEDFYYLEEELPPPGTEVQSFLFSGHMIDKPNSENTRFPSDMEEAVARQVNQTLDKYEADDNDYAFLAGAACGGDMIFIEGCLARGLKVHIHLPLPEPEYINHFIKYGGDTWVERYYQIRNHPNSHIYFQVERVGKPKANVNIFERNNRWALYSSLILGVDKVRLVALWDGNSSPDQDMDGMLVSNMVSQMRELGGMVEHLNISKLDYKEPNNENA